MPQPTPRPILASLLVLWTSAGWCQELLPTLDQLMDMEVTTAARKPQSVADSAASVFVITAEDIRRSGATCVPEALRLAPGVQAARIDATRWAVSIRGNNDRFANKLQVLLDGRTLYTPLYSGVMWEYLDLMLEEIDRIEVIRGPGSAAWGANAVNGVINIITRHAGDSLGTLASATIGSDGLRRVSARQGSQLGPDEYIKGRLQATERGHRSGTTAPASDDAEGIRAGVRWDKRRGTELFTASADINRNLKGDTYLLPSLSSPWQKILDDTGYQQGGYLLGRWEHTGGDGAVTSLQTVAEISDLDLAYFRELRRNLEVEYQRHEAPLGAHDLLWGIGARRSSDQFTATSLFSVSPLRLDLDLFSLFLQDEIVLISEHLRLTLGARLEHNDYTGYEFQPSLKLLFHPAEGHSIWTSISRGIRTPSRGETSFSLSAQTVPPYTDANPTALPVLLSFSGNSDLGVEELQAIELGWRGRLGGNLSAEAVAYLHRYKGIFTFPLSDTILYQDDYLEIPVEAVNDADQSLSRGLEFAADWRPADDWRMRASWSLMDGFQGETPYQFSLRVSHDLANQVELDLWLKRTGPYEYPAEIPAWTGLDLRVAWRPSRDLELALVGQNLLQAKHAEFYTSYITSPLLEIDRSLMVKATWRF